MTLPLSRPLAPDLLKEIPGTNPCGESLRYSLLFDQIKEARREDNPQLSQGIWEAPLKKADWINVESLCIDILQNKSKDLQCAGWLVEAWTTIDQLPGLANGIKILNQLCEKYWDKIYPEKESDDIEQRLHIFDWLDESLSNILITIPLITNQFNDKNISLADWLAARRFDTILKRSPDAQKLLKKAEADKQLTLSSFNQEAALASPAYLTAKQTEITAVISNLNLFKSSLDSLCQLQAPSFNKLFSNLNEMQRLVTQALTLAKQKTKADSPSPEDAQPFDYSLTEDNKDLPAALPSLTRESAYQQLSQLADFLEKAEPHSPTPQVLRRIVGWQNKNISDIFAEFSQTGKDLAIIAKLFSK